MKKIMIMAVLAILGREATAQPWEEKLPVTYKIDAVQKIDADIYQLAFNTQNNTIYVAGPKGKFKYENDKVQYFEKQYVYVLDGNTLAIKDSIAIESGVAPLGVGINNKTQTLYVGHSFDQAVTAIDLKTKKQTFIPSGRPRSKIREVVVDEANNLVYVSDHGDPSIWVIDGKNNTYKETLAIPGAFPTGLAFDNDRNRIYTTDGSSAQGNVLAFDLKTHVPVAKWKTWASNPLNIAIDYRNNRLFVSESGDNKVAVLDGKTGEIITKVAVGNDASPVGLAYDEQKDIVYVAQRNRKEIAVIDAKLYKVVERIPTKGLANTIVINRSNGTVYATNKAPFAWGDEPVEVLENGNTVVKIVKM